MATTRVIEVKENVFADALKEAENVRSILKSKGVYMINVMSSPGSGKTTTLTAMINQMKNDFRIGEMDVDIESDVDAKKVADLTGIDSLQINNGGLCHIDADMTRRAIEEYNIDNYDLLFLENIGNLVCPAEFDTGANINMMLLSVPEGDDKPLKYPLMFSISDIVLITKIDTLPIFNFDCKKAEERILNLNPKAKIFYVSAKTKEGIEKVCNFIANNVKLYKEGL